MGSSSKRSRSQMTAAWTKLLPSTLTSYSRLPYSNLDSNSRMSLLSVSLSRDLSKLVSASSVTRRLKRSTLRLTMTRTKRRKNPRVTHLKPKLLVPKSQRVMKSPPKKDDVAAPADSEKAADASADSGKNKND